MCEKIKYYIYLSLFGAISLLPYRILYGISDLLYIVLSKIVKYRRDIIRKNLRNSFPEKSETELLEIEKDFYHQFADNIVETVKLLTVSDKEADRRVTVFGGESWIAILMQVILLCYISGIMPTGSGYLSLCATLKLRNFALRFTSRCTTRRSTGSC